MVGLPSSIANDQLENIVCRVVQHIGANITDEKTESCHRLNKNTDRTIVKFLRRKDCDQIMTVDQVEASRLGSAYRDKRLH